MRNPSAPWSLGRTGLSRFRMLLNYAHQNDDAGQTARGSLFNEFEFVYALGSRFPNDRDAWEPDPSWAVDETSPFYQPQKTTLKFTAACR